MMNKRNKIIITVFSIIFCIAIGIIWGTAYNSINNKYPSPAIISSKANEYINIDDLRVKAGNIRNYDTDYFRQEFNFEDLAWNDINLDELGETRIVLVDFEIKYNGKNATTPGEIIDRYMFFLQSNYWSCSYDNQIIQYVNDIETIPDTIEYGDSFILTMPYCAIRSNLTQNLWDNFDNLQFEISINAYPYRYIMQIN